MCVEDRCTIVDVDAVLVQRLADVVRGVVGADHHGALADVAVRAGMRAGVVLVAAEHVLAGQRRHAGLAGHAGGQHQLRGVQREPLAVAVHLDRPALLGLVERRPTGTSSSTSTAPPSPGCRTPASRRSCPWARTPASSAGTACTAGGRTRPGRAGTATCSACATGRRAARGGRRRWRARRADAAARRARCRPDRRRRPACTAASCVAERGILVGPLLGPRPGVGVAAVHGAHDPRRRPCAPRGP